jgi:predicted dehydrogenase/aryl-alcohol dehydrogenase-like predicted oxidoreductase
MVSSKVRWGIIGTGAIAKAFARALPNSQHGELAAVASRSQEKVDAFTAQFPAPAKYASYEAMLADPKVQAVYISTPHPQHAMWAIRAIEAGKAVLCEKPLALNSGEVMAVLNAADERRVFFMEAFMYRCHPQTTKLVELVRTQAIGALRIIQASFGFKAGYNPESRIWSNALAGGGIMDVGCYPVSMSRLLAGAAVGRETAEPLSVTGGGRLAPTGVDEHAAATLTFPEGIVAQVSTSVSCSLENSVRLFGSDGTIVVANPWTHNREAGGNFVIQLTRGGKTESVEVPTSVTAYAMEIDAASQAILAGKVEAPAPAMTWSDSRGNMAALDAWRAAAGVVYDAERPERVLSTVSGRPLRRRDDARMPMGQVPHIDKKVSRLIMGCDNQRTMPHAAAMFDDFFERGGNCFDTAHIYGGGLMERLLGQWIINRNVRDQVVVIGKGAHTPNCNPVALVRQFEESLQRLQTGYVDLYLMHRDNPEIPAGEFVEVLNEQVRKGRMKAFGGSNWSMARVDEANAYAKSKGLQGFSAVSNNFSLARMVDAVWAGCIAASDVQSRAWFTQTQLPLLSWSSQARGFFTERGNPADKSDAELVRCWHSVDNFRRRERAIELAKKKGCDPIHIALAYVLAQPFPTFALIGPRQLSETRSSMAGLGVTLSADECRWLNLEA